MSVRNADGPYIPPPELDAPVGTIWVCAACGKQSPNRNGGPGASYGWDSSCMSNAVLCWFPLRRNEQNEIIPWFVFKSEGGEHV